MRKYACMPDQLEGFIFNQKRRVLEKLESRLRCEKSHEFYSCKTPGCKRFPFAEAFELLFKCPACNRSMVHVKNSHIIETLTRKINQIKKGTKLVARMRAQPNVYLSWLFSRVMYNPTSLLLQQVHILSQFSAF